MRNKGKTIQDETKWLRVGRGRSFEFDASDEVVAEVLETALPRDWWPYRLIAIDVRKVAKRQYERVVMDATPEDFLSLRVHGFWHFFVRSENLSPAFEPRLLSYPDAACSLNGLVGLQHGDPRLPSRLHLVDKVATADGSEFREHTEYLKIFQRLKRALKKHMTSPQPRLVPWAARLVQPIDEQFAFLVSDHGFKRNARLAGPGEVNVSFTNGSTVLSLTAGTPHDLSLYISRLVESAPGKLERQALDWPKLFRARSGMSEYDYFHQFPTAETIAAYANLVKTYLCDLLGPETSPQLLKDDSR